MLKVTMGYLFPQSESNSDFAKLNKQGDLSVWPRITGDPDELGCYLRQAHLIVQKYEPELIPALGRA